MACSDSVVIQRLANQLKVAASTAADRFNDVAVATSPPAIAAAVEHAARSVRDVLKLGRALSGVLAPDRKKRAADTGAKADTIDSALGELDQGRGGA